MEKKRTNFGGREASIPQEAMFEIFSWLPVKSLMRFKCVSYFCSSLVSESCFVDIYNYRSLKSHGGKKLFLQARKAFYEAEQKEDTISASLFQIERFIELYDPAYYHLNWANGLLCIWEPLSVHPAAIFNPSTRQVRFLPDPSKGKGKGKGEGIALRNYSLGFEPEQKKYKVFLSETQGEYIKQWVLTLGIDESWRETQTISPYHMPSVCISGVIYQFVKVPQRAIAAVDVKSENIEIIALWEVSHLVYFFKLIELKGQLASINYTINTHAQVEFDLWILEQAPNRKWQRHIIRYPSMWNYVVSGPISSCTTGDGKIIFSLNLNASVLYLCYDVITKSWRKSEIMGLPKETRIQGIYSYVETLDHSI